jgi:long-subunit fatty acid transport protein
MRLRLAAMAVWLVPAVGAAAGFEIPDNGTQALGRGGAFTAVASDGSAIQYNPAGLAKQSGLQLTVDANRFTHSVTFTRTAADGSNDGLDLQPVSNQGGSFTAPMAALSYGRSFLPLDRFTIAAGIYGPPAVGRYAFATPAEKPEVNAPNRYQLINNDIFIAYPTISLAYKLPIEKVFAAVGISGQTVLSHFKFNQDIYAQPSLATLKLGQPDASGHSGGLGGTYRGPGQTVDSCPDQGRAGDPSCHHVTTGSAPTSLRFEDSAWDANVDVDVTGKRAYTAVLGGLVKLGPVALGASYRPGYNLHADGKLAVKLPSILTAAKPADAPDGPSFTFGPKAHVDGDQTSLDLKWPSVLRVGLDVDVPFVPGSLDVSADYTYETWSAVDQFLLTPKDVSVVAQTGPDSSITQTLAPVVIPKHMQNSQSFRAGVGYLLPITAVAIETRLGGYYEKSALPNAYTTIDLAHFDRLAVTGGASVGINVNDVVGPLTLDLAAAYSPAVTREVRDSGVPLTTSDPYLAHGQVGNGNYTASVLVLSAGLRAHFGI